MPYKNIRWIKLNLDLINEDDRWLYKLNESQQLLFVKMMLLAALTGNKIIRNYRFIAHKINYSHDEECLNKDIQRIMEVFPKFMCDEDSYWFEKFDEIHNYIPDNEPRFKKPTVEQVAEYCAERKNGIDAQKFCDFYEGKGWKVGKSSMKDWKACVRTWENKNDKTRGIDVQFKEYRPEI